MDAANLEPRELHYLLQHISFKSLINIFSFLKLFTALQYPILLYIYLKFIKNKG